MPPKIEPNKPVPNEIKSYFHCRECIKELPFDESPMSYARYSVGATDTGFQVWCNRHELNIVHLQPR